MDGQWVTYAEAAARLGVSIEAVRQRAIRNKWARMLGNDKRARARLPDEPYSSQAPVIRPSDQALTDALRAHVETLKGDIEALRAQLSQRDAQLITAAADLESERARTSAAISAFASLAEKLDALAEARRPWWRRLVSG
jgi:chromosome segregation ATPase